MLIPFQRTKLSWFILLTFEISILKAQHNVQLFTSGSRDLALANATVSLNENNWACFSNPAGLAKMPTAGLGISCENRYSLKELTNPALTIFSPTSSGALGFSVGYFGTARYNSQKYTLCYAHSLSPLLEAGVSLNYFVNVLPDEYERGRAIAGDVGMIFHPMKNLNIGVHASNITASDFNISGSGELPAYLTAGLSWVDKSFLICTQLTTGKNNKTEISAGTEVALIDNFFVRVGASNSDRFGFSGGFGFHTSKFSTDLSCTAHEVLGLSTSFSIHFFIGKHVN